MTTHSLAIEKREAVGTGKLNALRRAKDITPAVIYGPAVEGNINVQMKAADLRTLLAASAIDSMLVELELEGKKILALVKNIQRNFRTDCITHVDFEAVTPDTTVRTKVPVRLTGNAIGVTTGGVVHHIVHELPVKCAVKDIPAEVVADVTPIALGESLRLAQVSLPENVTSPFNGTVVIASVVKP